jgi:hypothetical protein
MERGSRRRVPNMGDGTASRCGSAGKKGAAFAEIQRLGKWHGPACRRPLLGFLRRPAGAAYPSDTLLLNSPRPPTGGGGGSHENAAYSRPPLQPFFLIAPQIVSGRAGKNLPCRGEAATFRRRISGRHDGRMPACRSPVADRRQLKQRVGCRRRIPSRTCPSIRAK